MKQKTAIINCKMTPIGLCSIRTATTIDDSWVRHLSKIFSNQIGFIPDTARQQRIDNGNVKIITLCDQEVGFMIHSHGIRKPVHLAQIAISEEAWSNGIADYGIETLLRIYQTARHNGITANVRSDLRLNGVADRMSASLEWTDYAPTARGKHIKHYLWKAPATLFHKSSKLICSP